MDPLTLADLRRMLPRDATSLHLAHAAWLAHEAMSWGLRVDTGLTCWANIHPSAGELKVAYAYPDECPKIGQYETL